MAEIGLRQKLLVKDVMSSPAGTVLETVTANKVAAIMDKDAYGCIIVTTKDGKPIGIITERDLVVRVLAKNKKPDTIKAKKVMTAPVMTIEPEATISEAARRMSRPSTRPAGMYTITCPQRYSTSSQTRLSRFCLSPQPWTRLSSRSAID